MRIAFYAPLKPPTHPTASGDRRVARLLMDALRQAGHVVELASDFRSFDGAGDAARQELARDTGRQIATGLLDHWRSDQAHARPELWFTYHLYYKAPDWLGPLVCAALEIPYVVAEASYAPKRAIGAWSDGHAAVRDALKMADLLLCPTGDDVACLQRLVGANTRILRLPPFLDPAPYAFAARARAANRAHLRAAHDLDQRQPWLLVVAMMRAGDKLHSYQQLGQALEHLADLPWQLLVAGDGPQRAAVQHLLAQAAPGRFRLIGACDAQAMAQLYGACDLCVWPAVNEAYGMAMLEAQAAGMAVVSCSVRGVPDVVRDGHTGLLAAPGDMAGLARHVRHLLCDPQRRRAMGRAAARFVGAERSVTRAVQTLGPALHACARPTRVAVAAKARP